MSWTGKIVGGVLGALAFGPLGAALGALLGHEFLDARSDEAERETAAATGPVPAGDLFFRSTFEIMGHIAKADGRVSEQEIRAARQIMAELRLSDAQVREAIAHFTNGKAPGFDFDATVRELRRGCAGRPELLGVFLEIQMRTQLAASDLRGPARATLQRLAGMLGASGFAFAHIEAILRIRAQSQRAHEQQGAVPAFGLAEAYEVLEVEATAGDEEIEKAYRRQLSRHHPDKLRANGLPDSMLEHAKQRTQQIIEAWELIRERRGIR
jgi:DnaJ like chaperone protein